MPIFGPLGGRFPILGHSTLEKKKIQSPKTSRNDAEHLKHSTFDIWTFEKSQFFCRILNPPEKSFLLEIAFSVCNAKKFFSTLSWIRLARKGFWGSGWAMSESPWPQNWHLLGICPGHWASSPSVPSVRTRRRRCFQRPPKRPAITCGRECSG